MPSGSRQSHNIHANTLKRACKILVSEGEGCSDTNVCVGGGDSPSGSQKRPLGQGGLWAESGSLRGNSPQEECWGRGLWNGR